MLRTVSLRVPISRGCRAQMRVGFAMRTSLLQAAGHIGHECGATVSGQECGWKKLFIRDGVPYLTHDFGVICPSAREVHHAFPITNFNTVPIRAS